jgi:low temperature requirement protein LtrA
MSRFARPQSPDGHSRASTLELFYDLVFVFAVTQVSHTLLHDLTWEGAGQAAVILLAVWWSWNYTTWATNELDTSSVAVRGLVVAVMLGSLLMSIAIPEAWGDRALLFAGAYVAIQVGRGSFMTFVAGTRGSLERMRASRILIWFIASGGFWIAGALADGGEARTFLWLVALLIDYAAPLCVYRVPFMERIRPESWDVATEHFAERFQLFVIIALGESVVITGAVTANLKLDAPTTSAFVVAFLGSAALWWLYFNRAAAGSQRELERAPNRTTLARDVYTYLHALIVAGVIVSAIGDELVIKHPDEALATPQLIALAAGPVIYLLAMAVVRLRATGSGSFKRPIAALTIVAIGVIGQEASALLLGALILVVLVALIAFEEWDHHRRFGTRARRPEDAGDEALVETEA